MVKMSRSIGITVDIGSSTTKIVVIGPAGVVHSQVLPVAGNAMDEAIAQYIRQKYKLLIGERTVEVLRTELDTARPPEAQPTVKVRGQRLIDDAPEIVFITDEDVREALADIVSTITEAVMVAVKNVPAELSAAVTARGIVLQGGGGPMVNIAQQLMSATSMAVRRA